MNPTNITFGDIYEAAAKPDLDEACALLQGKGGITEGDLAGQFFDGNLDLMPWAKASRTERVTQLIGYVRSEIAMWEAHQ